MPAIPEIEHQETGITEPQEELVIPETLQQPTGVRVVQKNFKLQVTDDQGRQVIQTPPVNVIQVNPPESEKTLEEWTKGPVESTKTWLGMFWKRVIKKAISLGWRIVWKEEKNATG